MKYVTEKLKDAMEVYKREDFNPDDVLSGVKWRKDAMEQWAVNNLPGLTPVVTSDVPVDDSETCISCAAYIDFSKDERREDERSYKMNTCHECLSARKIICIDLWRKYKQEQNRGESVEEK